MKEFDKMAEKQKEIEELQKEIERTNKRNLEYLQQVEQAQQANKKLIEGIKAVLNKWHLGDADIVIRQLLKDNE